MAAVSHLVPDAVKIFVKAVVVWLPFAEGHFNVTAFFQILHSEDSSEATFSLDNLKELAERENSNSEGMELTLEELKKFGASN